MKMSKSMLCSGLLMAALLTGCKSKREALGDKYLEGGDPMHAVMYYDQAMQKGPLSTSFYRNYVKASIQVLTIRAKEDPTAEFLDALKDSIVSILKQHPDPTGEAAFVAALQEVGRSRIKVGSTEGVEGGFRFLAAAESFGGKAGAANARKEYVAGKLTEIQGELKEVSSQPTAGIVADYKMTKLALTLGTETDEMKVLWSQIRKANLNTYLMYDNDDVDLGERPDSRINKYGVLLGIVKYEPGATTKIQVKAWNGSSGPFHFDGDYFTLFDKDGKGYKPTAKIGHFSKKDVVGKADESKTGGVTFKLPAGAAPSYLEFKSESGVTRKYLP